MKFTPAPLAGAFILDIEPIADQRGFFARTVCRDEFARHGLQADFVQQSVSWNPHRGTVRGLHYQLAPYQEDKLVRVTRGAIFDVIVDMRRDSTTFGQAFWIELSAENRRQLYIPKGLAHGFQSLLPDTEIHYEMSIPFTPGYGRGVRWDDPKLAIPWPAQDARLISDSDRALPLFDDYFSARDA